MDLRQQFLMRYDRYRSMAHQNLLVLTDEQLRARLGDTTKTDLVPWVSHLWSMARHEDRGFAQLAAQPELIEHPA